MSGGRTLRLPALRLPSMRSVREWVLTTGGLGSLTAGAWTALGLWAGLLAAGISLLLLNWLAGEPAPTERRTG